jgi:hypothetical protein
MASAEIQGLSLNISSSAKGYATMQLPALKNAVPASLLEGQSIEDFIRNSTRNLQRSSAAMPGNGVSQYLKYDGTTGQWSLNREAVDPKCLGRIVVPQYGLFESCVEWANGSPLQRIQRQLLGVEYKESMSEKLLEKPLSPGAYKKQIDGPTYMLGFAGVMLDDGTNVVFEHSSMGAKKAVNALATTATQALAAFGEFVHPVIELGSSSFINDYGTIYDPRLTVVGYVTDKRAKEADTLSDGDIIIRPTASRARLNRKATESPAI